MIPDRVHREVPTVSAVVVTYRSAGYVEQALVALDEALARAGGELVVVDNASADGVADLVNAFSRRAQSPVTFIGRAHNDGFAAGCHVGADHSEAKYLLWVNPDVIVEPDAVGELLRSAKTYPQAGIWGGRAVDHHGETAHQSWWGRPTLWSSFCFATGLSSAFPGHRLLDPEAPDRWNGDAREVDVVSGAFMLVDRQAWDALGGLDRSFLLYGEDADFCLRATAAGWRPRVVPAATYFHAVGRSSEPSLRTALVLRGRVSVLRRHLRPGTRSLGAHLLVMGCGLRAVAGSLSPRGTGRSRTSVPQWRAAWRSRRSWVAGWGPDDTLEGLT